LIEDEQASSSLRHLWRAEIEKCFPNIKHDIKTWKRPPSYPTIRNVQFEIDAIFARFYIPIIWPDVKRYIYLDNDIIVTSDLMELFQTPLGRNEYLAPQDGHKPPQIHTAVASSDPRVHRKNLHIEAHEKVKRRTTGRATAAGFVFDSHPYHIGYKRSNFNTSDSLVQRALSVRSEELFLNGGVAIVDAEKWRQDNLTGKAERIIQMNRNGSLYSSNVGDQGTYALLLQEDITYLPSKFNMRRHPKRTISMLSDGVTGTFHSLHNCNGTTLGILCSFRRFIMPIGRYHVCAFIVIF
jgi:lipopolysaccharide biosynthesis glycosyltransferase